MEKYGNKKFLKRSVWTLVVTCVLICTGFSVTAEIMPQYSTSNDQIMTPCFVEPKGNVTILVENFSGSSVPPTGWTNKQTDPSETWYLDSTFPHGDSGNCATVHRASSTATQDEWLITPSIDLRKYSGVNLTFWWYTSCYTAHWKDYVDLNVQVSTDNGSTWKLAWSDDYIPHNMNYTSWSWLDSNRTKPINLQQYAGKRYVTIGFQYYSNSLSDPGAQEASIDDIWVYGNSTKVLNISAGGPYYWCWENQNYFIPPGVRFHGSSDPPYSLKQSWYWDFGDNGTSKLPLSPIHVYRDTGTYHVTLIVVDATTKPPQFAIEHTNVTILSAIPPVVDIIPPVSPRTLLLFGVQALVKNDGVYNATNISWNMIVHWGPRQAMEQNISNGTIEKLVGKTTSAPIKSKFFIAFGPISVTINVNPENLPWQTREFRAIKIGPFVLLEHRVG